MFMYFIYMPHVEFVRAELQVLIVKRLREVNAAPSLCHDHSCSRVCVILQMQVALKFEFIYVVTVTVKFKNDGCSE